MNRILIDHEHMRNSSNSLDQHTHHTTQNTHSVIASSNNPPQSVPINPQIQEIHLPGMHISILEGPSSATTNSNIANVNVNLISGAGNQLISFNPPPAIYSNPLAAAAAAAGSSQFNLNPNHLFIRTSPVINIQPYPIMYRYLNFKN